MNKGNKILVPVLIFVAFALGAGWSYLLINQLGGKKTALSQIVGNYTIDENSISGAVEKVYDATVTVLSYKGETQVSSGTGFVYKEEGSTAYIMTNNHVIASGDSAKVLFSDGTEAETKILGGDTYADIAVLSTSSKGVKQIATIGKTDNLKLGDTTFAVGAPLGDTYSGTVTKGILSGKDRLVAVSFSGTTSDYYMKVLQTDAALNPGNSGGPLCNINGEVIGVTSLKLTQEKISLTSTYSVEGMGFAIPIEDALYYAEIIEAGQSVKRPYIGISMLDITDSYYLWQAGITIPEGVTKGVAILEAVSSSPAEKAGLKKGDIIVKLENEKIESVAELRYELYKHNPGDKVTITYNRNGKEKTASITLEETK
ncbi:MAG: trypsin-like peptidase domain-containing protein [Acholeplasmatales bacterium]|nr:trypsin-like peptidase domain-containing protein [Acholeplasmatales bacterium]